MNVSCVLYDNSKVDGRLFDVSQIVPSLKVETSIFDNPGKCTFDLLKQDTYSFQEGATFAVVVDGHKLFKGYVFSKKETQDQSVISVTCYDALWYFKNKDSKVYSGVTSWQIARDICNDLVLPFSMKEGALHVCAPVVHDNKAYYEMVKRALDDTLTATGEWYIIRDNFGVIEHCNVLNLRAPFIIGDQQGLISYDYETSIDKDTYNQIKLYRDNDETSQRDIFIVNDTAVNGGENIRKWGILQLYESVDENLNIAQIEEYAFGKLKLYNNTKKSVKLNEVIGFFPMSAGYIFPCRLTTIHGGPLNQWMLCTDCTHTISNGLHTMSVSAEVVNSEWG